jgi:uncharacterized protein YggE
MRNKTLIVSIVLLAALALSACGPAVVAGSPVSPQRTLSVAGTGQVSLTPDIAYIYVGVHTENPSASEAMAENNSRTQQMISALKEAGVDEKDIRTTNFSIWPMDKYDPSTNLPTGQKVYSVDNTVYVTVRDLAKLGDLLDTLVTAGANTINSIAFDVADKSEAVKEARAQAVKDGEAEAKQLAADAGLTLGEITNISFYEGSPTPYMDGYGKGGGGGEAVAMAVPIQPGQLMLTVTVNMVYEIK